MYYRVGLSFNKEAHERLLELSKKLDMGQTPLIECLLYGLTIEEARSIVKKGSPIREESISRVKKLRQDARSVVNQMNNDQLKALVKGR